MSQFFSAPTRPDTAAGAIAQHLRVKTTGALVVATAADVELGTMEIPATAAGPATVRLRTAEGTAKMVASGAITAGVTVYAAAGGKVASSGTVTVGTAMEAATADNDVIEVLRHADAGPVFVAQSITADDSETALNTVLPGSSAVYVDNYTNDANDFIVLPALASVPIGWAITVVAQAQGNFEVRTPASSGEEINSEDCDGTKEYLLLNTQVHIFRKIDNTIGWMAQGFTALGAVATAVVPD
jgi:hypothetical protein